MRQSTWVWLILGTALILTGGLAFMTISPTIRRIGEAIATAEGFYMEGSRPQRNNNPGDLTVDVSGKGVGMDGPYVIYATAEDGFSALYKQISKWLAGTSKYISASMTISQAAQIYSPSGWMEWSNNVANYLGVSTDTPLNQIV